MPGSLVESSRGLGRDSGEEVLHLPARFGLGLQKANRIQRCGG